MTDALHILVVDDEPDVAPLIRMRLRKQVRRGEYKLSFAGDGVEALEVLEQEESIELVLTDINMPRMDGLRLLGELSRLDRLLKSVVLTAYGDMDNIRRAMNEGAFDFLTKPLNMGDLALTINKAQALLAQQKRADLVRQSFGRYLSEEVAAMLLAQPEALKLGGEKREVTIMMSDLRGFSMFCEQRGPEEVVEFLNIYLGRMTDIISKYQGTIDEFIGDAILVVFGAPLKREDDALRALACAVEMQLAMTEVNELLEKRNLPRLDMGIGIHTGEVVVGNIGSLQRMKYGVVGSPVNMTGRVESYTVGGQILTTDSTLAAAGPTVVVGKEMKMAAKGMSEPISIREVRGVAGEFGLSLPEHSDEFKPLEKPWPFDYTVLDGKHMTGEVRKGEILELSATGAVLRPAEPVEMLCNLLLTLAGPDGGDADMGEIYAKVVEGGSEPGTVEVRFTAVPEQVAEAIRELTATAPD